MLVLTRRKNERIILTAPAIPEPIVIEIQVAEVKGGKARLGITAPPEIQVSRAPPKEQP